MNNVLATGRIAVRRIHIHIKYKNNPDRLLFLLRKILLLTNNESVQLVHTAAARDGPPSL
jgi:hypothetical protein